MNEQNLQLFKKQKSVFHRLAGGQTSAKFEYGFSLENPIRVEQSVKDFELYEYAIVSYFCTTLNAEWELYGCARNVLKTGDKEMLIDEVKFRVSNPKSGRPPLSGSMYFDITDCVNGRMDVEEDMYPGAANGEGSRIRMSGVKSFNDYRKISGNSPFSSPDRQGGSFYRF